MSLLERIAHSDGDPQRTIAALRLINERQVRELRQCQGYSPAKTEVGQRVTTRLEVESHVTAKVEQDDQSVPSGISPPERSRSDGE